MLASAADGEDGGAAEGGRFLVIKLLSFVAFFSLFAEGVPFCCTLLQ